MRLRAALATFAACALGLAAGGLLLAGGNAGATTVPATIKGYAFDPPALTVPEGTTVTWKNEDTAPHTVTSEGSGPLDSPNLQKGDSWSFTFTKPGTYPYYCAVHPDMKGTVTVTAAATSTTAAAAAPSTTMPMDHMGSPPTTAAPTTSTTMDMSPTPTTTSSLGLVDGVLTPFWVHLEKAHLEESPGEQVGQALDLDQYVKTHTVMVEQMLAPLAAALVGSG
jgi:plastocyanin